ncbi:MAG: RHS repeat protein, partial [Rhodocyclales bacterium]|nr:RHS repeat protein [Rhodocyclales bacterium]
LVRANLHDPDFNLLGEPTHTPAHTVEPPATSCPDNRLENLDGVRYRFDARGNLIERSSPDGQRLTLGYDALGRLTRAERYQHGQHLLTAIYQYDVFGRRRTKYVYLIEAPDARPRLRQHARYDWRGNRGRTTFPPIRSSPPIRTDPGKARQCATVTSLCGSALRGASTSRTGVTFQK